MSAATIADWKAVPAPHGGYYIHRPGSYNTLVGHAATIKVADEWIDKASGAAYQRLPEVRKSELTVEVGEKCEITQLPRRKNDYYQHTFYYYGNKRLGSIQTKFSNNKYTVLTLPYNDGGCIQGGNLRWLCEQNGLRLVDDTN